MLGILEHKTLKLVNFQWPVSSNIIISFGTIGVSKTTFYNTFHYLPFSVILNQDDFSPQGAFGKVWRHFLIIMTRVLGRIPLVSSEERAVDTIIYPARHTTTKDILSPEHQ